MRRALLILVAVGLSSTGCAALVASSGVDPDSLTPQRLSDEFGVPTPSDDSSTVTFRTRRKISEPERANDILHRDVDTLFGAGEAVQFPIELCRLTKTKLFGREVVVEYGPGGLVDRGRTVDRVRVDGDTAYSRNYFPSGIPRGDP